MWIQIVIQNVPALKQRQTLPYTWCWLLQSRNILDTVSCWRSWALKSICLSSVPGSLLATWPWNSLSSFYLLVFFSDYSLITAYYLTGLRGFRKQCQWVLFTSLLGISGMEWSIRMREVSRGCEMFELSLGGWVGVWSAQNVDGAPGMGCQHEQN